MQFREGTDLALRVLLYLAVHGEGRVPVRQIAAAFDASESHLAKVAQALARAGFVATTPGRTGGLRLARSAAELRLGAVVRALEPVRPVECFAAECSCDLATVCGLEHALRAACDAFLATLDTISVAECVRDPETLRGRLGLLSAPAPRGVTRAGAAPQVRG